MKKILSLIQLVLPAVFIFISCEKEIFVGVEEDIHTSFGKIFVNSNPPGYKVYIDDKFWGVTTPDSVRWLSEGTHKFTLRHQLFSDSSISLTVKNNEVQSFDIDMLHNPRFYSSAVCYSIPPGSSIFVNDQPTGRVTPATIRGIYPGTVKIKYIREGCRDDSLTTFVKGGQSVDIYKQMDDTTKGVDYRTVNTNIPSDVLNKVVIDKSNNKWIGSINHALLKFDGKTWTSYEYASLFDNNIILDLLMDSKGRLWVGTSMGLKVFDGFTWQSYDDKLPSSTVTALEEDPLGNIWIGTINGLVKYNNSSFQLFNTGNSGLPENIINCITFSPNGDLWVGTSQFGVIEFSNNVWKNYLSELLSLDPSHKITKYISDFAFDKNGVLWAFHLADPKESAGRSALIKYDNGECSEFHLPLLFSVEIVSFYVDSENNKWISSKEGLIKYNETKPIKVFNNYEYGFYVKHCTSIAFDKNGDLWATTMGGGLVKLKKEFF